MADLFIWLWVWILDPRNEGAAILFILAAMVVAWVLKWILLIGWMLIVSLKGKTNA